MRRETNVRSSLELDVESQEVVADTGGAASHEQHRLQHDFMQRVCVAAVRLHQPHGGHRMTPLTRREHGVEMSKWPGDAVVRRATGLYRLGSQKRCRIPRLTTFWLSPAPPAPKNRWFAVPSLDNPTRLPNRTVPFERK
jgi:hypothetical protein